MVDAALIKLAIHVKLSLDDTITFKNVLDRRVDLDLKKIYLMVGRTCKPPVALALASIYNVLEVWIERLESAV